MSNVLGQIIVDLLARTASFESGMNASAKLAQKTGKEIESAFQSIGSTADKILSGLGPVAGEFGAALEGIGASARGLLSELGPLAGALGPIGVGLAAIAAVGIAGEAALVGLAIHAAEGSSHLGELSKATGIGVESLSLLGDVAATKGIGLDEMGKAMERMSRNALQAANGTGTASKAFAALGVQLLDSNGQLRSAESIFNDVASAMAKLPDGTQKTALAIQIFGRAGAELIPLLDRAGKGIDELEGHFRALGAVQFQSLTEGAEEFKEQQTLVGAAFTGIANRIEADLLPALTEMAKEFVSFFEQNHTQIFNFIDDLAWITKATIAIGGTFKSVFEFIGLLLESSGGQLLAFFSAIGAGLEAVGEASIGDFSASKEALRQGYAGLLQESQYFLAQNSNIWQKNADFIASIMDARLPRGPFQAPAGGAPGEGAAGKEDTTLIRIQARIEALRQEAADWANIAASGTQAEALIAEAVKKGNAEFGKLKAEAAKSPLATSLVINNEDLIKTSAAESVFGAAIKSLTGDLDKQQEKLSEQGKAALSLAAAFQQGGAAIASAELDKQFSAQEAKINVFRESLDLLGAMFGKNTPFVQQFAQAIDQMDKKLAQIKENASVSLGNALTAELIQQGSVLAGTKPYVDALNDSYLQGELAVRGARIELQLYEWEQNQLAKGITVTVAQKEAERGILKEADKEAYDGLLAQEAARFDLNALYDQSIEKLERVKEVLESAGASTLLIDAQIQKSQEQLIKQWDDAAFAVGTFQQKVHGVFNELVLQGQQAGASIAHAFLNAIDDVETQFAKLLTGQKVNFTQVIQNLAESVTKAEIQKGVGELAGKLGIHLPGLEGKPDGSASRPLHVIIDQLVGSAALGGGGGPLSGGLLGSITGLFKGLGSLPFTAGGAPTAVPGVVGATGPLGDFSFGPGGLTGLFGGFLADGGDVTPGKGYILGERGPEPFFPKVPGTVLPSSSLRANTHNMTVNNNFNVPQPRDLFGRTGVQEMTRQFHRAALVAGRR